MFQRKFVVFVVSKSNCAITLNRWTEFNRHCQFVFSLKDPHTEFVVIWLFVSWENLFPLSRLIGHHPHANTCKQLAFCELTATDSQQTGFLTLIFRAGAEQRVAAPAAGGHRQGVWLAGGGSRGNRRCHGGRTVALEPHSLAPLSWTSVAGEDEMRNNIQCAATYTVDKVFFLKGVKFYKVF